METGNNIIGKHHIEDEGLDLNLSPSYHLSIQVSLDGFYFCILDSSVNKFLALHAYSFEQVSDWQTLSKEAEKLIRDNELLQKKFKSTTVSLVNNKYTLVPAPLFDASRQKEYLQLNAETESSFFIRTDTLKGIDAKIIYGIPLTLDLMLRRCFPLCRIVHHVSGLIENLTLGYQHQAERQVFVNAGKNTFDVLVTGGKNLIFCNSFSYEGPEDFLYYLLFVFEQLKLNPDDVPVVLAGVLDKSSEVYALLYKYVRTISFAEKIENYQYSYKFDELPKGAYFSLLSQLNH